jgi:hypothetical protein
MKSSLMKQAAIVLAMMIAFAVAGAADEPAPAPATANLTLHNLCSFPVWPLITANAGLPDIPVDGDGEPVGRLDGDGAGLATLAFPGGAWSGRITARTGCSEEEEEGGTRMRCATGEAPPVTVAQVSVGGPGGLAEYSVSLVDGFNLPVVVTPHGFAEGRRCPSLGCAVDLCGGASRGCGAGATAAGTFKQMCPDTRTNSTDVEVTPQDCIAPGELKVVFCPARGSSPVFSPRHH